MKLKRLNFGSKISTKALGNGIVEVVVSTNSLDRHGEMLSIKGLDTSQYNGTVLLNHDYGSLPIGKSISLKKKTDGENQYLISQTQFAVDEYPLAATVYKLVKGGFMTDVSIGFIPKQLDESTMTWTKAEMIEYSFVTVGANPDAKVTAKALASVHKTIEEFDNEVKDAIAADKIAKGIARNDRKAKMANDLDPELAAQLLMAYNAIESAEDGLDIVEASIENAETILEGLLGIPDDDADEEDSVMGNSFSPPARKLVDMDDEDEQILLDSKAISATASALEKEISAVPEVNDSNKSIKRKIVLISARKKAQALDRLVETVIAKLKQ